MPGSSARRALSCRYPSPSGLVFEERIRTMLPPSRECRSRAAIYQGSRDGMIVATAESMKRGIGLWLLACCGLVWIILVTGGVTRLTHSGLSIVEWKPVVGAIDRKSTRLNSSHANISYAVFCLKKKN